MSTPAHFSGPPFQPTADHYGGAAGFVRSFAAQYPENTFTEISRTGERVSLTNAELYGMAIELLLDLQATASPDEADIVLCFESALDFTAAVWACVLGGYCCLPWHHHRFRAVSGDAAAKLELVQKRLRQPVLLTTASLEPQILQYEPACFEAVLCTPGAQDAGRPCADLSTQQGREMDLPSGSKGAFLVTTSGTTANLKLVTLGHDTLLNRCLASSEFERVPSIITLMPFDGTSSLGLVFPFSPDSFYVQPDRFAAYPLEILAAIEEFRIETFGLSTSLAARLSEAMHDSPRTFDVSPLKHISFGAELIIPGVVRQLATSLSKMGAEDLKLSFVYAMTETGRICNTTTQSLEQAFSGLESENDSVSVGGCSPDSCLRVVDDDDQPVAPGAIGNIQAWSSNMLFSDYRGEEQLSSESFTGDGWFRTGDRGKILDADLQVTGRQKAIVIINGQNVALEAIERPLRRIDTVRPVLLAAVAVRTEQSASEELAVFFVPNLRGDDTLDTTVRMIRRETMRTVGIAVNHIVPLGEEDFPLTPTGKIRRTELAARFERGQWAPHRAVAASNTADEPALTETEAWLVEVWKTCLKLDVLPSRADNFFDLGGDSLASAELFFTIEEKFSCQLRIEEFFRSPTIARLAAMLVDGEPQVSPGPSGSAVAGTRLLHKLKHFTGSWQGQRLFPESLVVGLNTSGSKRPIFWVFQDYNEFTQLAQHLDLDQPLYGMRSCVGIVEIADHSADILETVGDRYLWEILALGIDGPLIVGGNCQGGILALALARKLRQIARTPSPLILMEWDYSFGRYEASTLLLYGAGSHTAALYQRPENSAPDWRTDFPQNIVKQIPGSHGEFFRKNNVPGLAQVIAQSVPWCTSKPG